MAELSTAALWWAVVGSGVYHGLNPGMGWPLAVSAALMEQRDSALGYSLAMLAAGHVLAMMAILLPFTAMTLLVTFERELKIVAALVLMALGLWLLVNRRHPRFLARVQPGRLVLWSFLAATAHGAGLMLVPIYLGICKVAELDIGHQAAATLMVENFKIALSVALTHTLAMALAGGLLALGVYRWLGLAFLSKTWFNLDSVWALSLIAVGAINIYMVF